MKSMSNVRKASPRARSTAVLTAPTPRLASSVQRTDMEAQGAGLFMVIRSGESAPHAHQSRAGRVDEPLLAGTAQTVRWLYFSPK